eukprot:symbB.v1.2.025107.t1/scaffold2387.1/size80445/2
MYDFAHGNEDAIEGVTHSICTLEFENHRALYDWFLDNCSIVPSRPYQKEFARLEVQGAVTSKRKLLKLVKDDNHVSGWDDPRLLTIRGIRRRGVRPQGIKCMADAVGVSDRNSTTPWDLVEECWREDLEPISKRRLAVLDPLEVEIVDYTKEERRLRTSRIYRSKLPVPVVHELSVSPTASSLNEAIIRRIHQRAISALEPLEAK